MGNISVLPEAVINKIAAGEVVERPASVVKELVENALDAGASQVEVEIRNGGKSLVRVRDDGCGMGRDDAVLAIERHSTSKIAGADDLFAVRTMGFRGERSPRSRPSRGSRSSRREGGARRDQVFGRGGRAGEARDAGAPEGTEVTVRDLFFNVPARRKFLKSEAAENPASPPPSRRRRSPARAPGSPCAPTGRSSQALPGGLPAGEDRLPLRRRSSRRRCFLFEASAGGALRGFVSPPGITRGNRAVQYLFVNGRPVQDRILSFAVSDACDGFIPARRYPVAFVYLEIEPREVDVNVHPAKREVRFRNAALARDLVRNAVSQALGGTGRPRAAGPAFTYESRAREGAVERVPVAAEGGVPRPPETSARPPLGAETAVLPLEEAEPAHRLRVVGQVKNLYVVCEDADGIAVVDQHAAHERILFEKVMRAREEGGGELQRLLIPSIVELSAHERALAAEHLEAFRSLGIGLEPFGKHALKVDHLPACLGAADPEALLRDVLAELAAEGGAGRSGTVAAAVAARSAAPPCGWRDPLRGGSSGASVDDLMRCRSPFTCPHGAPDRHPHPRRGAGQEVREDVTRPPRVRMIPSRKDAGRRVVQRIFAATRGSGIDPEA